MSVAPYSIDDVVMARVRITEGGGSLWPGDPEADSNLDRNFIHAEPHDIGKVVYVDTQGYPSVQFDRTGSTTVVAHQEIQKVIVN